MWSVRPAEPRTKNSGQNVREPPLCLVGFPTAHRFDTLCDDHPAYALARFAWHYGADLDEQGGRALLAALLELWPRKQGRRSRRLDDTRIAYAAKLGVSPAEIARAWGIKPDTAQRRIDRGEKLPEGYDPSTGATAISPRIVLVAEYLDADAELLPEPRHPADLPDLLDGLLPAEAPAAEWAESRARLAAAAAMGLPERVTLDVLLPAGPITVEGIPTASREAAWQVIDRAVREHGGYPDTPGLGPGFTCARDDEQAQRAVTWLLAERRAGC